MPTTEEYMALGVGGLCPQCSAVRAAIRAQEPDAEYIYDGDVGELLIKHGIYGEFIACSSRCGYTRSIPGRSHFPTKAELKARLKCQTCSGSHYIPFVKPDGSVSRFAQLVCPDCGGCDHERDYASANIPDRLPDDFDFTCSYDWRSFYEEQATGRPLQPLESLSPLKGKREVREVEVVVKHVSVYDFASKRQVAKIYRLEDQVKGLTKKVTEIRVEKKTKRYENYEPF